jgi:hypothetical protein
MPIGKEESPIQIRWLNGTRNEKFNEGNKTW